MKAASQRLILKIHVQTTADMARVFGSAVSRFSIGSVDDGCVAIEMPGIMHARMLTKMRDHLPAIQEIQDILAAGKYEAAADIAENRLGMSSLQSHGASQMAGFTPKDMQEAGKWLHQVASPLVLVAREAVVTRNLPRALGALSDVTANCVA